MADAFGAALKSVLAGGRLTRAEARAAMGALLDGGPTDAQVGAFLGALRVRGETVPEIVGFAEAMRARAKKVVVRRRPLIDTCGTGGDSSGTFNISTTVAFVAAGAGAAVAKHGNRAVSSKSGSADVLEALGIRTDLTPAQAAACVESVGIGFLFAPSHHPGVARVGPVRRQLGTRTVFNLLGPLCNPAGAPRQLLGVYATALVKPVAEALKCLGAERALVVSSRDGLDELSPSGVTVVATLSGGRVLVDEITPEKVGLKRRPLSALKGGDAKANARILRAVLSGDPGPAREAVLLNAAAALIVAGLARDWREGVERAAESIDSGRALGALDALKR
ncbi:MAG: anthranilate phosphoribosyltransferase, partial [Elusimicrobia bacterium]|nr:anthranilate phosphoribosyltransferase [Elusimicrobiota bacterium]